MKKPQISLIILSTMVLTFCGGTAPYMGAPWNPSEEKFFDNGIDIIETQNNAFGQWGFQQENAMDGRIQLSDFVAIVEVRAIKTITNVDQIEAKHIEVLVRTDLYGNPPDSVLSLRSSPAFPGYNLVKRYEKRLKGEFILFSRWFEKTVTGPDSEGLGYRFHLSPASPSMVKAVKDKLAMRVSLEEKKRQK